MEGHWSEHGKKKLMLYFLAVDPPPTHHLEKKTLQSTTHLWPSFDEFQCIQVLRFLVLCEHHCAIGTTIKVLNLQTILQVAAEEKLETVVHRAAHFPRAYLFIRLVAMQLVAEKNWHPPCCHFMQCLACVVTSGRKYGQECNAYNSTFPIVGNSTEINDSRGV